MTNSEITIAIAVIALMTVAIRVAPFLVFSGRPTPTWLNYLGRCLPFAVMGMLVVYSLKSVRFTRTSDFLPELIASALVVGSYVWKRNTLLSIVSGTAIYMLLVQLVFV